MTGVVLLLLLCILKEGCGVCDSQTKPCDWEPWQPWGSCSRTCSPGFRSRTRKLCCGEILPNCSSVCSRGDNGKETETCNNKCLNGGSVVDGMCQCPPLKYGICCERDEKNYKGGCARHCTWVNWFSWSACSADCGCGKRTRRRVLCCSRSNATKGIACHNDCNMHDRVEERVCTASCQSDTTPCKLCSWESWQSWTPCSQECGGGQRSRTRAPCCCSGQEDVQGCLDDCGLSVSDTKETSSCGEICHNQGTFVQGQCLCPEGYSGQCCENDDTKMNSTKCSLTDECDETCSGPALQGYILTGALTTVGYIIITSIVWCICQRVRRKGRNVSNDYEMPTFSETDRGKMDEDMYDRVI